MLDILKPHQPNALEFSRTRFASPVHTASSVVTSWSTALALLVIFLLGVFLGRVAGVSWLYSGIRTLLVALLTAALIYLLAGR